MNPRAPHGYLLSSLVVIIMTGGIVGCSSNDNPTEPPPSGPNPTSGVFLDSPVEGLGYSSGADSGLTTSTGEFSFEGSTVSFFVGDIQMGSTNSATAITPVELAGDRDVTDPHTTNIARFLQTIDDDGDPNNGILITDAVRQAAIGKTINFDRSIAAFPRESAGIRRRGGRSADSRRSAVSGRRRRYRRAR